MRFNSPPGWPTPPAGWTPPVGWKPSPSWPEPPDGWQLWLNDDGTPVDNEPAPQVAEPEPVQPSAEPAPAITPIGDFVEPDSGLASDTVDLDDQRVLQQVGIYRYHHPLEDAAAYKTRLSEINDEITVMVKAGTAVLGADMFTLDNSLAKGRAMVRDLGKLTLRAYNAEADNCVRALRSGNISTAKKRLEHSVKAIEKLGALMQLRINPDYHDLRVRELELTADWQMKKQEEREEAREERERLREQRKVEAELAAERERLDKERSHYVTALAALGPDDAAGEEMRTRLGDIDAAIEANDYRAANIRAGYVYVISNVGAFGPGVVKIGLTRRLEPRDRIRDLGDASVPFRFDTHALFFSDDAVSLERELHEAFADRRLNQVNLRREFFFATPQEVRDVLETKIGGLLEFRDKPDAEEYAQSRNLWPTEATTDRANTPG
jgi:hypothetical protein